MIPALALAASLCTAPQQIPAGPVHVEAQCSYFSGAIAAEGDLVFASWMTSRVGCCSQTSITGSTSGGPLDARGSLRIPAQQLYNRAPSPPSVATNGTKSLVAWSSIFSEGTFVQFADEQGTPLGDPIRVAGGTGVPRALWDGSEWIVVTVEGTTVVALHLDDDGDVTARDELAAAASLLDANESLVLVRGSGGVESVLFSGERHLIPAIPASAVASVARNGDAFLVAWNGADAGVGMQRLDAHGAPIGDPVVLEPSAFDPKRVAVASIGSDFAVLWSSSASLRAVIVHDGAVAHRLDTTGMLLDATTTRDGVVALVSRGCGVVTSLFLPRGAIAFADSGPVSLASTPQTFRAAAATARGTEVLWTEAVPATSSMRLFATFADDVQARGPVPLSSGTYIYDADVVPMRDGSVAAWIESTPLGSTLRAARFDASGELIGSIVKVASAVTILNVAIAADDDSIVLVTPEKHDVYTYSYFADLWSTRLSPELEIEERTIIATRVEAYALDAAMGAKGAVSSWFDYAGLPEVRTTVREPQALHVFTLPANSFELVDLAANGTSLLLWLENGDTRRLHALRADSGEDTVVAEVPRGKYVFARVDRAFRIVWAESDASTTQVHPGPCLAIGNAFGMTLRNGSLDALLTVQNGRVILARSPLPRRRSVR
jgi:hypothetical protein